MLKKLLILSFLAIFLTSNFSASVFATTVPALYDEGSDDDSDDGDEQEDEDLDEDEEEDTEDSEDDEDDSDSEDAADALEDAAEEIEEAAEVIEESADDGKDVSQAEIRLEGARELLAEAQAAYDAGDYENAEELAEEAKHEAMYAKGKDIQSSTEEAELGASFAECIQEKMDDDDEDEDEDEDDFEDCFEDFFGDVYDHVFSELPEDDQNANLEIQAAVESWLPQVDGEVYEALLAFTSYNFSGVEADEVIEELEDILTEDEDEQAEELRELLEELKEESVENKFEADIIPFKDTDDEEWFFNFVAQLESEACVEGFKDANGNPIGEFKPGNQVLFGESLKFVLKCVLNEDPAATDSGSFWAEGYAIKIKLEFEEQLEAKIRIKLENALTDEDEFNEPMTRAELLALIINVLGIEVPEATAAPFEDVPLTHRYVNEIAYALELGVITGDQSTGTFRPDDTPNRAEVAKIVVLAKQLF